MEGLSVLSVYFHLFPCTCIWISIASQNQMGKFYWAHFIFTFIFFNFFLLSTSYYKMEEKIYDNERLFPLFYLILKRVTAVHIMAPTVWFKRINEIKVKDYFFKIMMEPSEFYPGF